MNSSLKQSFMLRADVTDNDLDELAGWRLLWVKCRTGLVDEPPPFAELLLDEPTELPGWAGLHVDPAGVEEGGRVAADEDLVERGVEGADQGVLAGAKTPYHWVTSTPSMPASCSVGTPGSMAMR